MLMGIMHNVMGILPTDPGKGTAGVRSGPAAADTVVHALLHAILSDVAR